MAVTMHVALACHTPAGISRAGADRWIFVFMATLLVAVALAGFIPSSLQKIAQVQSGQRSPFPVVLHVHAVLMGSWLLLLLTQASLVAADLQMALSLQLNATGLSARHCSHLRHGELCLKRPRFRYDSNSCCTYFGRGRPAARNSHEIRAPILTDRPVTNKVRGH